MERNDFQRLLYYYTKGLSIEGVEYNGSIGYAALEEFHLVLNRDTELKVTLHGELTADWKKGLPEYADQ